MEPIGVYTGESSGKEEKWWIVVTDTFTSEPMSREDAIELKKNLEFEGYPVRMKPAYDVEEVTTSGAAGGYSVPLGTVPVGRKKRKKRVRRVEDVVEELVSGDNSNERIFSAWITPSGKVLRAPIHSHADVAYRYFRGRKPSFAGDAMELAWKKGWIRVIVVGDHLDLEIPAHLDIDYAVRCARRSIQEYCEFSSLSYVVIDEKFNVVRSRDNIRLWSQ